ncbi:MAG: arsenic metallochaperone ArsD family protein, partial [Peptostreptococcaceae bacterium]
MSKMKIFESAECTIEDTPGSKKDSELMRIHYIINTLRQNGIEVERYNIVYDDTPFVEDKNVYQILNNIGINGLPIIIVNEEIVISGRYPS